VAETLSVVDSFRGGMKRDFARTAMPQDSLWSIIDLLPDVLEAPARKRGGYSHESAAVSGSSASSSYLEHGIWVPFSAGDALIAFDAAGYAALLIRLKSDEPVVYAPEFRREIEEPIAGAIAVPSQTPLVVTEGNYLLLQDEHWAPVRDLLDETWYVETDEELRVQRLIQRHIEFGKTPDYARAWVLRSDERNAAVVAETALRADVLVRL